MIICQCQIQDATLHLPSSPLILFRACVMGTDVRGHRPLNQDQATLLFWCWQAHITPFHCVVAEAHYLWQKTSINIDFSKNNGTLSQLGCLLLELTREPLEPSLDNRMYWHEFSYQQYFRIQSWFIATSLCPNWGECLNCNCCMWRTTVLKWLCRY